MGKPTADQLTKINQLALVPLTEDQVYTFPAKVIGTRKIDKYLMKITPNFLSKMAEQAKQGVALLIDHPWMKWEAMSIPYGRTYDSRIVQEGTDQELYADHYMVLGQEIDEISTDQLAIGIDGGTIFDTSAGFVTTKHLCSICGGDYFNNPDCTHVRGMSYDSKECLLIADDGYLMENSLVFDGGYEGAGVVKNNLSHKQSDDKAKTETLQPFTLDAKSLPGDGRVFYSFSNKTGLQAFVSKTESETERTENMTELEQAKSALTAANNALSSVRDALKVTSDDQITGTLAVLQANAQLGETYKTKVIEGALGAGVRALGDVFNSEAMKGALSNLPVAEVEKIRDTYEAQAKAVLGNGGQHVVTASQELPDDPTKNAQAKTAESREELAKDAISALKRHGHADIVKEDK